MGSFLVFGARADDEVVGGTITKLTKVGDDVFLIIFTKGEEGYAERKLKDTVAEVRQKEIGSARHPWREEVRTDYPLSSSLENDRNVEIEVERR